jgi:hypothetical protein
MRPVTGMIAFCSFGREALTSLTGYGRVCLPINANSATSFKRLSRTAIRGEDSMPATRNIASCRPTVQRL